MAVLNSRISLRPEDGALLIEDTEISDNGDYTCKATNGWGTPVEAHAQLDVLKKMEVLALPEPARYTAGRDYTFDCAVEVSNHLSQALFLST